MNESPAPTVSTTPVTWAGSLSSSPDAARQVTPSGPSVTTVSAAPSSAHRDITSDEDFPAYSQSMSSSEHLTTSERATSSSTRGRTSSAEPMIVGRMLGSYETVPAARARCTASVTSTSPGRRVVPIEPMCRCPVPAGSCTRGRFQCRSKT